MENRELISIVVPIYNVEPFLKRCINSIIEQTYTNIEIILVNDGSRDNSLSICNEYKEKDSRVIVINKENGGLGSARNAGINIATGKYIMFIDSDDYISNRMAERLFAIMKQQNADIVACDFCNFYEDGTVQKKEPSDSIREFSSSEALKNMFWNNGIRWGAWNKLYKKELFEGIRYAEGVYSEDMATTYLLYAKSQRIIWTDECLYFYFIRSTGIMKSKPPKRYADEVMIIEELCDFYGKNYPNLKWYPQAFYGKIALNNMIGLINSKEYEESYKHCVNALINYGKYALKADFVDTKYKFIIAAVLVPMKVSRGKFAYSKVFEKFAMLTAFYLK